MSEKKYPLSKDKDNPSHRAHLYRGVEVIVTRQYSFNQDYCTGSMYVAPSYSVGSANRERFKRMIDRRLDNAS